MTILSKDSELNNALEAHVICHDPSHDTTNEGPEGVSSKPLVHIINTHKVNKKLHEYASGNIVLKAN